MRKGEIALLVGAVAWPFIAQNMDWPASSRTPMVAAESRWVIPAVAGWAIAWLVWMQLYGRRKS